MPSDFNKERQRNKDNFKNINSVELLIWDGNPLLSKETHFILGSQDFFYIKSILHFIMIFKLEFDILYLSKNFFLGD